MLDTSFVPRQPWESPYSMNNKIKMAIWWLCEALLFRPSLHKMNGWRCFLLRIFGACVGKNTFINSRAKIWFPWNLEIGDNAGIGFDSLIYNLDKVYIGNYATVAQRCHIVTGSHDYRSRRFELVTKPVTIEAGAFIGTDSYIGPGVTIHKMAVVAARSVVIKDLPEYMLCGGHPCVPIKRFFMNEVI